MRDRSDAENAVMVLRAQQAEQWDRMRDAIVEYFLLYGVDDEVAWDRTADIIDGPIDEVISRHLGEGG